MVAILSASRLTRSLREIPLVLKKYLLIFLAMTIVNLFFTQIMIYLQELRMNSKDDIYIPIMLLVALIGFIVQSVIHVAWTFIVCHYYRGKNSLREFIRHHLEQGLIESLRAFFRSVLWGFLFIIPGFHKFFQYQFVIYIVGLDDHYERGEVDALDESKRLSDGHLGAISVLSIALALAGLGTSSGYFIFDKPHWVLLSEAFGIFLVMLETIYYLHMFRDIQAEKARP